eukprot:371846-Pyramimonas_sp.AAC.1
MILLLLLLLILNHLRPKLSPYLTIDPPPPSSQNPRRLFRWTGAGPGQRRGALEALRRKALFFK